MAGLNHSVLRLATSELGGPDAGVYFVDHGDYAAQVMENLGETIVDENYPNDHTHTAPDLVSDTTCLIAHATTLITSTDSDRLTTSRRPSCWVSSVAPVDWAPRLSTRRARLRIQLWGIVSRTIVQSLL